jgi:hypothetical protein
MEIRIPFILRVSDYHEFDDFATKLNGLFARTYKRESIVFEELGVLDSQYIGIFTLKGCKLNEAQKLAVFLEEFIGKFKNLDEVVEFFAENFDTFKQEDVAHAVAISLHNYPDFYKKKKAKTT